MSVASSSKRRSRVLPRICAGVAGLLALLASPASDDGAAIAAIPPTDVAVVVLPLAPVATHQVLALALPEAIVEAVPVADETPPAAAEPPAPAPAEDLMRLIKAALPVSAATPAPRFAADYRSLRRLVALTDLPRAQSASLVGVASTYNPYRDGPTEGGVRTASGEFYDPMAWTAAIQRNLRDQFGGVRFGRLYQPTYALVESGDRQAIVKINDVGPLKPGRIIDLNERSMRYFDPFLVRGLLSDVRVTLLPGEDWTPGPVGGAEVIRTAGMQ